MFIHQSEFDKVISGNIKKKKSAASVNICLTNEQIKKLNDICEETGIPRHKYVREILEHYWSCNK